ncbi:MAG: ABC transporter substrate-binding protein [Candidatus Thorarchaeota archaeon]
MGCRRPKYASAMLAFLVMMLASPTLASAQVVPYEDWHVYPYQGPFIDKLVSKEYQSSEDAFFALVNDDVDMLGGNIPSEYLTQLSPMNEPIGLVGALRNGYGHLTINCLKYPYNITAFRRALAFALDKEMISDDIWGGQSQPHDSPVSAPNPFTIEGLLPYTYYTAQPDIGNQLLDDAGFHDVNADGIREAPDGTELHVVVTVGSWEGTSLRCAFAAVDALDSLHISAETWDWWGWWGRGPLEFDIIFYGTNFGNHYSLDWLPEQYGSMYTDIYTANVCNFRNSTFDDLIPDLLYSTEYDDIYGAAIKMQEILVYECPRIVCYNPITYTAYRTDIFENHVIDPHLGLDEIATFRKVHKTQNMGGQRGGTFRFSNGRVDTFNPFKAGTTYAWMVLGNVHVSLLETGPDANPYPFFAESYDIQTNADNPCIPVGHTRIIFDMIQNATWSDGYPITAEDVAFSLNYIREGEKYGLPSDYSLQNLTAAHAASLYRVIVEFDTLSYWHLGTAGEVLILPKHIFKDIPVDQWADYNPIIGDSPHVTAGPFIVTEHVGNEFTELTSRTDWPYGLGDYEPIIWEPSELIPRAVLEINQMLATITGVFAASVVILIGEFALLWKSRD